MNNFLPQIQTQVWGFFVLFFDLILNEWVLPAFRLVDCYFFCMLTVLSLNNILNWAFLSAFIPVFSFISLCLQRVFFLCD